MNIFLLRLLLPFGCGRERGRRGQGKKMERVCGSNANMTLIYLGIIEANYSVWAERQRQMGRGR